MKRAVLTLYLTLLIVSGVLSQRTNLVNFQSDKKVSDSLRRLLPLTKGIKEQALIYQALCWNFKNIDLDSTEFYGNKGIALAQQANELKIVADITRFKGIATWNFMHHNKAFDLYNEALEISKKIGDAEGEGFAYDRIGVTYFYKKQYIQAEEYFEKGKKIFLKINHLEGLGYTYSHLNWVSTLKKDFKKALYFGSEALKVRVLDGDKVGESNSLSDIGLVYKEMGDYNMSLKYLLKAFKVSSNQKYEQNIAEEAQDIADVYLLAKKYNEAFIYAKKAFEVGSEIENELQIAEASKMLTQLYEQKNDFEKALHFKNIYHNIKDSLFNDEVHRNTIQHELEYNYQKEKQELVERNNLVRVFLCSLLAVISTVAVLIFIGRRRKQKDNELLQLKNNEIQEQKKVLEAQAIELEQSNTMKNKLFSIISHDLKTPFANTSMLIKLFNDGIVSDSEFKEILPRVDEQLKNSSELLDNLLLWAKNQMDGYALNVEKLNMFVLVENHLELFKITSQNKGIFVVNAIHPLLCASADKAMIEIVLRNLISNSLKFCQRGDTIKLAAFEAEGQITVSVEDTGTGISKERVKSLFKGHLPSTKGTANESGTGLGLMLSKDLIEKNGGKIWVESIEGEGTTFYFSLPFYFENRPAFTSSLINVN